MKAPKAASSGAAREVAIAFADNLLSLCLLMGCEHSTAHKVVAEWWRAIERGDFGDADAVETRVRQHGMMVADNQKGAT